MFNSRSPVVEEIYSWSYLFFYLSLLQELEAMTRYTSPVNPAVFPHLTVVLLAIGMFFTAWFFVYPFTYCLTLHCVRVLNERKVHTTDH